MEFLGLMMSLALGATLLLSGASKVTNLSTSARIAAMVGILPKPIGKWFGTLLPFAELVLGTGLMIGYQTKWAAILTALLLFSFIVANLKIIIEEKDLACNCFGNLMSGKMGWGGLIHSLILLAYCVPILLWPDMSFPKLLAMTTSVTSIGLILVPTLGLFLTGLVSRLADLS